MSGPGVIEALIVDEWLFARLNGDATLRAILGVQVGERRVSSVVAPSVWGDGPFVTFAEQSPMADTIVVGGARVFARGLYTVKAIRKTDTWTTLRSAAERVDALLHGATGTAGGGQVLAFHRDSTLRFIERDESGAEWRHLGGTYRVTAQ